MTALCSVTDSSAENLFISMFEDVFGTGETGYCFKNTCF